MVSRAFSALYVYSTFGHHPRPLGYTTFVPNFVSFATSIVTLADGERVSKSLELYQSNERLALFDMLHLTCGTNFLLLFVVLISSIHHHHPALLHRHALIVDRLLTFLVTFSTLILKLSFSQSLSLHSCHIPSSLQADVLEF